MSDNYNDDKKEKRKTLIIRVRSAAILTLIAFAAIIPGGLVLLFVNSAVACLGMYELQKTVNVQKTLLQYISSLACGCLYLAAYLQKQEWMVPLFMIYLLILFACMVVCYPKYNVTQVMVTFASLIYVGLGMSYIYLTRTEVTNGAFIVWLIFICSWISDSGAYLTGIAIGKHKAFPKLSPKKSVEGCIGGVLASIVIGILYKLVLDLLGFDLIDYPALILICGVGSVFSQIGDLAASAIKRFCNIKDYSNLIPGHGGILDRFDSIIFVAPLVYYLGKFLG